MAFAAFAAYALFLLLFNLMYFTATRFKSDDGSTPMLLAAIAVPLSCFLAPGIGAWGSTLLVLVVAGITHFLIVYIEPKGWVEADHKYRP